MISQAELHPFLDYIRERKKLWANRKLKLSKDFLILSFVKLFSVLHNLQWQFEKLSWLGTTCMSQQARQTSLTIIIRLLDSKNLIANEICHLITYSTARKRKRFLQQVKTEQCTTPSSEVLVEYILIKDKHSPWKWKKNEQANEQQTRIIKTLYTYTLQRVSSRVSSFMSY